MITERPKAACQLADSIANAENPSVYLTAKIMRRLERLQCLLFFSWLADTQVYPCPIIPQNPKVTNLLPLCRTFHAPKGGGPSIQPLLFFPAGAPPGSFLPASGNYCSAPNPLPDALEMLVQTNDPGAAGVSARAVSRFSTYIPRSFTPTTLRRPSKQPWSPLHIR